MRPVPALLALVGALAIAVPAAPGERNASHAGVAYTAMQRAPGDTSTGPTAWPYSQALAATIALSRVPHVGRRYLPAARARVAGLEAYAGPGGAYAPAPGSGDLYFDDNEWIALDLLDWHDRTGARAPLTQAKQLFRLVTSAWDADPSHPCAGGIFWTTASGNHDRNTVTTATGALLAMRLFDETGTAAYVQWTRRLLGWVEQCMAAPNGLLWDHIDLDGTVNQRQWSYNQGTALGAYALLYRATGDQRALRRARALARASLATFDRSPRGSEPSYFLAIFFRNLLLLDRISPDPSYRAAAQAYADALWSSARDGWPTLLQQAAVVQMYAALAAAR